MPAQQINAIVPKMAVPLIQFNNKFTKAFVDRLYKAKKRKHLC